MPKRQAAIEDYIVPLDMNGLSGRMLHLPPPKGKKSEILFVYGQHSSLERWWGLLKYANRFAAVTAPDLPGFGGMESFYKIGEKPTLDNFADYLAAFIKMRYRNRKVVVIGMSYGFAVVTRMLQRYPELVKNVRTLVSLVGLTQADEFAFSRQRYWFYRVAAWLMSRRLAALFFRYVCLSGPVLRATYHRTYNAKSKFAAISSAEEHKLAMDMEIELWHNNDVRTHAWSLRDLLTLNNAKPIALPVWHIDTEGDQYFNHERIIGHMKGMFKAVHVAHARLPNHAPSIIADEAAAAALIPAQLRQALQRLG